MPAEVTFVSSTEACITSGSTLTCPLGTLSAQATTSVTIVVAVDPSTSGVIYNAAMVSGDLLDPDAANNSFIEAAAAVTAADLSIVKTANPNSVLAGELLTYTLGDQP